MKTYILHLDPHDDIVAVREKMGWSPANRVLLVWPGRRSAARRLDMLLLKRHSQRQGVQLALVAADPKVRFYARELGLPVFKTLGRAQKATWRVGSRLPALPLNLDRPRPDLARLRRLAQPPVPAWMGRWPLRVGFFSLGILAMLSVAAILLPGAQINLEPERRVQEILLEVQAGRDQKSADLPGALPAAARRATLGGDESLRATGTSQIPDRKATGRILLTNVSEQPVFLPSGSAVRTLEGPVVRFETTQSGWVPAGAGEGLSLPVRARLPGREGNLPTGALAALEGLQGLALTVTNPVPTQGGADLPAPVPVPEDYGRLEAQLEESLRKQALEALAAGLEPGDVLLPDTLTLRRVVKRTFDPPSPQPSDWLHLSLRLEYEALVVSEEDIRKLAVSALDSELPEGYLPVSGPVEIAHRSVPVPQGDGRFLLRLKARRELRAQVYAAQVVGLSRGVSPAEAQERLSAGLNLYSLPRIRLLPSWWPRLPYLPFRIQVIADPS